VLTLVEDVSGTAALTEPEAGSSFTPYCIVNETGVKLYYRAADPRVGNEDALEPYASYSIGRSRHPTAAIQGAVEVLPGERRRFDLWPEVDRLTLCAEGGAPSRSLAIQCDGWSCLEPVPISRTGVQSLFPYRLGVDAPQAQLDASPCKRLVCEVSLDGDQRVVRVSSTTRFRNESSVLLAVRLWQPERDAESVHPLEPGYSLPMPLRSDAGAYRICLRPMDGEWGWSAWCLLPSDGGNTPVSPTRVPLQCAGAKGHEAWNALISHEGFVDGVCEATLRLPFELTNVLARELRFELRGSGCTVSGTLGSGETRAAHQFAPRTPVALTVQIDGYAPSERVLVWAPIEESDEVLCKHVSLYDRHHNALQLELHYESKHRSVHSLKLIASYWVLNLTSLPIEVFFPPIAPICRTALFPYLTFLFLFSASAHPPIAPICRTALFPYLTFLFLFSAFAHPPIAPICRTALFPHLTFLFFFARRDP
jgi:hypothetical protein